MRDRSGGRGKADKGERGIEGARSERKRGARGREEPDGEGNRGREEQSAWANEMREADRSSRLCGVQVGCRQGWGQDQGKVFIGLGVRGGVGGQKGEGEGGEGHVPSVALVHGHKRGREPMAEAKATGRGEAMAAGEGGGSPLLRAGWQAPRSRLLREHSNGWEVSPPAKQHPT